MTILKRKREYDTILVKISDQIELTPTNLSPLPISSDRQRAFTIYRLATGYSYATLSDVFGVSVSSASMFSIKFAECLRLIYTTYT